MAPIGSRFRSVDGPSAASDRKEAPLRAPRDLCAANAAVRLRREYWRQKEERMLVLTGERTLGRSGTPIGAKPHAPERPGSGALSL